MVALASICVYAIVFSLSGYLLYLGHSMKDRRPLLQIRGVRFSSKHLVIFLGLLLPITLGLVRYGLGADYAAYLEIYHYHAEGVVINNNENYANSIEVGFHWLAKLSYTLTGTPILFFGIPWTSTVVLAYFGLRKFAHSLSAEKVVLAWLVVLPIITALGFNQIRQTLAITILFFALTSIVNGTKHGYLKYAIAALIASLFHLSSLVVAAITLALWFAVKKVRTKKQSRLNIYILAIGSVFICVMLSVLLYAKGYLLDNYHTIGYVREFYRLLFASNGEIATVLSTIDIRPENIIVFSIFLLPIIVQGRGAVDTDSKKFLLALCYTGLTLSLLSLFMMNGERLSHYFIVFAPVCFYLLLDDNKRAVANLYPAMVFFLIMFFGWQTVTYYHTIFNSQNINLNAVVQRRIRSPYSQALCLTGARQCSSLFYYDESESRQRYIYKDGELWKPGRTKRVR